MTEHANLLSETFKARQKVFRDWIYKLSVKGTKGGRFLQKST